MKILATLLAAAWIVLLVSAAAISSSADPIVIVFYEEGCPSCVEMEELLVGMLVGEAETVIIEYEITEPGSLALLESLSKAYDIEIPSIVPIVFVGNDAVIGMGRTQEFTIRNAIGDCLSIGCESPIARLPISQLRADLPRLALFLSLFLAIAWLQLH